MNGYTSDDARMEDVRARLRAWIAPNAPEDEAQRAAFGRAAEAQAEYEAANGEVLAARQRGVRSFRIGSYSETYATGSGGVLCPSARAILENAGLLRHGMPVARRLP